MNSYLETGLNPPYHEADMVENAIANSFELTNKNLTSAQVSQWLGAYIQSLPGDETKVIAVVGGPASGKSTLVEAVKSELEHVCLRSDSISTDDYNLGTRAWRHERERDDPLSLKDFGLLNNHLEAIKALGKSDSITVPVYDELTGMAIEVGEDNFPHRITQSDIIIVEGDFDPVLKPDLHIFIDAPIETRIKARIDRDLVKRGEADPEKIAASFNSRHEKQYIPITAPAIKRSDLVLKVSPQPAEWLYGVYEAKSS